MKRNDLILLIMFFVSGGLCVAPLVTRAAEGAFPAASVLAPPAKPTRLPDFEFANLDGGSLKSSEMKGKVIIIRFWATW